MRLIAKGDGDRRDGRTQEQSDRGCSRLALKHVVRPRDTVVVLGVFCKTGKKSSSCVPLNMGISIQGIWEKLDLTISSVLIAEVKPRVLGEEIERKMEEYRISVQPFYKQCKRNEVKLEMKHAVGLSPGEITITEAQNSKTRWIVLDSHLKKCRFFIYGHVGCNVCLMKGKDVASLIPSAVSILGWNQEK